MANSVVSISLPRCVFFTSNQSSSPWLHHPSPASLVINPSKHSSLSFCSYSPSSASVVEEEPADAVPLQSDDEKDRNFSGCKACGNEEIESGCNGDGRMQGGIATIPGFGWWPIKAYRPCPAFLAAGGRYRRTGQSMDEVASGRGRSKTTSSKVVKQQEKAKS